MASNWIMFHCHLYSFTQPPLGGRPYTKPGDHGTLKLSQLLICYILSRVRTPPHEWNSNEKSFGGGLCGPGHISLHTRFEDP